MNHPGLVLVFEELDEEEVAMELEVPELDEPQMSITIRFKPQSENLLWPQPIPSPNYCHNCQECDVQHLHRQVRPSNFNIYRCNCNKNAYVNVVFISTIL